MGETGNDQLLVEIEPISNFMNFRPFGSMALKGERFVWLFQNREEEPLNTFTPSQAEATVSGVTSASRAKPSGTTFWKDLRRCLGSRFQVRLPPP